MKNHPVVGLRFVRSKQPSALRYLLNNNMERGMVYLRQQVLLSCLIWFSCQDFPSRYVIACLLVNFVFENQVSVPFLIIMRL